MVAVPEITEKSLRSFPKILLHDHLDGGLRPETIISIAKDINYKSLPSYDAKELAKWMLATANQGKLELYLDAFTHTIAVMQTEESLFQVAEECVIDLANDGIVYAEVRFAPELFQQKGLKLEEVVQAVLQGFQSGMKGRSIKVNGILCAMRSDIRSEEIAEVTAAFINLGIVGFDIAGPEIGFPPLMHSNAFDFARKNDIPITIHAGEAAGPEFIEEAFSACHASRIGHGISIRQDITFNNGEASFGKIASELIQRSVPLEICPTSNVHTGIVKSIKNHPVHDFLNNGLSVTINTDNRLMSSTNLTSEFLQCRESFGWSWKEICDVTDTAITHAFLPQHEKDKLKIRVESWEKDNGISGKD